MSREEIEQVEKELDEVLEIVQRPVPVKNTGREETVSLQENLQENDPLQEEMQIETEKEEKEEKEELIRHIYELAVHTRGQRLTVEDQMIALSTCSSGNTNGRHLLICKVIKENTVEGSETE